MRNISDSCAHLSLSYTFVKAFLSYLKQCLSFIRNFTDREGPAAVSVEALVNSSCVDAYYIAFFKPAAGFRDSMDYFLIN